MYIRREIIKPMRINETVRRETSYVLIWVLILSVLMEAVFLVIGAWELPVLWGNLIGDFAAVMNFALLALTVTKAVDAGLTDKLQQKIHATKSLRMLGMVVICVLAIALLKTNPYSTLIPLIFPSVGLKVKKAKQGGTPSAPEDEGSELT